MADTKLSKINQNICGLCEENPSKYCCPRCELFYCSLDCYKSEKHQECSESFYRECVNEELTSHHADEQSRDKITDILKRMHDEDNIDIDDLIEYDDEPVDSDDEEEIDLEDRLKDLNLDDADAVWNALTEDEKNEFEALLNQGDVGSIMPQWEPWWVYHRDKKLVEDVDIDDSEALKKCPELKTVPKFQTLTALQPSPAIKNNITNVLAAYAFIIRYFNGEIEPAEAVICLLNICDNLDNNTNFDDPAVALESVVQKCLQSELIQTDENSLKVMKTDTFHIIRGPSDDKEKYYCQVALSHLHQILSQAKSIDKQAKSIDKQAKLESKSTKDKTAFSRIFPEHEMEHLPKLDVSKVKKCLKKVEYYLSYIESFNMNFE